MSKDMAASVHQRLLNHARKEGVRFNDVLQRYALERWLYRLSKSDHSERFILKGALMLTAWDLPVTRPTRDIDMLAQVQNDLGGIRQLIADMCRVQCEDDGLIFAAESVTTESIAEDALYEGVRVAFKGSLGNAQIAMQIDLGFSDVVTPAPVDLIYPTILEHPAPHLQAYNRETAIAEKFEAMVKLGELNSRMKDFFDVWLLAENHPSMALHFRMRLHGPSNAVTHRMTRMLCAFWRPSETRWISRSNGRPLLSAVNSQKST